ncbi:MAG: F0F1 ATP synthase subunit delta [Gammaproteobacteria bacterium]|nr:F0F1 ATP synthase subunit delta [Gammaproteobacteria bacterium]
MAESRTLARPFGKAAFLRAVQIHALEKWSRFLQQLSDISKADEVKQLIRTPALTRAQKVAFFVSCVDEKDKVLESENFLWVLAYHKKLYLLPDIYLLYEELRRKHEKTLVVELFSAKSLPQIMQDKFQESLSLYLGQKIVLKVEVHPALLGGALIRAGDVVIDGSLKGRLQKLKQAFGK